MWIRSMNAKKLYIVIALYLIHWGLFGQDFIQIIHTSGSKDYAGVLVNITSHGKVDSLSYCNNDTWPFYLGYNSGAGKAGEGYYHFEFSAPLKEVMINLSALSHSEGTYSEEARIWVNDQPYRLKSLGVKNSCNEPLTIITPEGFIRPCKNCSGSGMNGIKINGPITSVRIESKILLGEPMGFVASLYIRPGKSDIDCVAALNENASGEGKELSLTMNNAQDAQITIKNSLDEFMPLLYRKNEKTLVILDVADYPSGTYKIEIKLNGKTTIQNILIP